MHLQKNENRYLSFTNDKSQVKNSKRLKYKPETMNPVYEPSRRKYRVNTSGHWDKEGLFGQDLKRMEKKAKIGEWNY